MIKSVTRDGTRSRAYLYYRSELFEAAPKGKYCIHCMGDTDADEDEG